MRGLIVLSRCPACSKDRTRTGRLCKTCQGFGYLCDRCEQTLSHHPRSCPTHDELPTELRAATPPFYPILFYLRSWPNHDPPYVLIHQGVERKMAHTLDIFALTDVHAELQDEAQLYSLKRTGLSLKSL